MIKNLINHIVFVVDRSGSMQSLSTEVVQVFDSQIKYLAQRSKELDQETRVSVYLFDDIVECLIYDTDVLRLPSLSNHYVTRGSTALIDATLKAIEDLEKTATLYGDHSFLFYTLTDGANNINNYRAPILAAKIKNLPENWTVAVLVPDQTGVFESKKFGFPPSNIQLWSTDNAGINEVGNILRATADNFMKGRATGVRGTKSLFQLDTSNLTKVKSTLKELKSSDYIQLSVHKEAIIKPFIESWKIDFRPGAAYYQLTKKEKIQGYKQICIQNKANGKIYSGPNARSLLGLPDYEVAVDPTSNNEYDIFIQSTSNNRKLVAGTKLIVLK